MSTIIIVLLVIVLAVAIFLKKRADSQSDAAPKKGASKTTKKAATKTASRTVLVQEEATPPSPTSISESLRQSIQQSIQIGNYQTAEAQINQALKQDDTQHELYLLLLDIHLLQKDDFAIDHLVKHIQALQLDDILQAAEAKQREYESSKQPDSIEFSPSHFQSHSPVQNNNAADFDALVESTPPATQSFNDLQSEYSTPAETKEAEPTPEVQPLDFDFSFEPKNNTAATPAETPVNEQAPLDFSLDFESTPTQKDTKPTLDFSLSDLDAGQQVAKTEQHTTTGLDFNFEQPQPPSTIQPVNEKTDFSVEQVTPELSPVTPAFTAHNDPLAQSFPDLQQLDEAQLNLDLAEQYIELGAYESARILLKNSQSIFNPAQQQQSEKLLNSIAS